MSTKIETYAEVLFSIVICCFNSRNRIRPTLEHLAAQQFSDLARCELIIVDNNSSDGTGEFGRQIWTELGAPCLIRVVNEARVGSAYAREAGAIAAARNNIVFVDDDNWLSGNWLAVAADIVHSVPDYGAFGGSIVPCYETAPPTWVRHEESVLACDVDPVLKLRELPGGSYLFSAGLVMRKEVYLCARNSFGPWLLAGRSGSALASGEDIELCYRVQLLGLRLYRYGRLVLRHFIPSRRTSFSYLRRLARDSASHEWLLVAYRSRLQLNDKTARIMARFSGNVHVATSVCMFRAAKNILDIVFSSLAWKYPRRYLLRFLGNWHQIVWLLRHHQEFHKTAERIHHFPTFFSASNRVRQ
jgi:glycosyltransferase involved in cell wall biosynthesis